MTNRITAPELEQFIVATVQLTGRVLGAGSYGSVEEVEIPGATVAAKKLHEALVNLGSQQQVDKWVRDFVEECKLMSRLRHPHVVQFLGVCYFPGSPLPVLLMEKLLTSLDNLLETSPNISIDVKVHLLAGTCRGLVYLHSHNPPVAHRDLSAKNVLVDNGLNAKIADLGVSRIVNVRPGQLAATMTHMPGTGVYMPPEATQDEGATRYNTGIDIFSFGVVSLFTLTQTFPKDLKPHNYRDPVTRRLIARSEIERREDYIVPLKAAFGETHPLVQLTLDCLEYDQEDRPSTVVVLTRLEEVGTALPQNCTQTKLQLIQSKESEIQQATERVAAEKHAENSAIKRLHLEEVEQRDTGINQLYQEIVQVRHERDQLQVANNQLQATIDRVEADGDRLQAENRELRGLEELITLQQRQLEVKGREIDGLSHEIRMLQIQVSEQRGVKPPPQPVVPSSITFNWTKCKNIPEGIEVYGQPVTVNEKLYMRGESNMPVTVLVYTPDQDHWDELPPPPVKQFAVATLRGQLLGVGGRDRSLARKKTNTILTFDESSQRWLQSLPLIPVAVSYPVVVEYQDHLIVAGGRNSNGTRTNDVNILDTTTNKWTTAKPLPNADRYYTCLIGDTLYLVGRDKQVLRADVPSLISRASSGVWETVSSVPWFDSHPVTVGNTLLTVGGRDRSLYGKKTTDIHLYDPTKDQWIKCGDLPKPMDCYCTQLFDKLYVFEASLSSHFYVSTFYITH